MLYFECYTKKLLTQYICITFIFTANRLFQKNDCAISLSDDSLMQSVERIWCCPAWKWHCCNVSLHLMIKVLFYSC